MILVENTKNYPLWLTFFKIPKTWSFHVVVLQRTASQCTKIYNARAELLFCSLNLLFDGVLVAVAVVVCISSVLTGVTITSIFKTSCHFVGGTAFQPKTTGKVLY